MTDRATPTGERDRHEGMVSCLAMVLTVIRNYEGADSAVERELRLNLGADLFEAAERENAAHVG